MHMRLDLSSRLVHQLLLIYQIILSISSDTPSSTYFPFLGFAILCDSSECEHNFELHIETQ
ncbi:hypothetical protein Scep_027989 [Stephania cephalantha]|uniref:Uncharacterized protein n=1 Tax=Stephania cephalantha TaxID=152367 RepID=A0AAP0EDN3_9MAGN